MDPKSPQQPENISIGQDLLDITTTIGSIENMPEDVAMAKLESIKSTIDKIDVNYISTASPEELKLIRARLRLISGSLMILKGHGSKNTTEESIIILDEVRKIIEGLSDPEQTITEPAPEKTDPLPEKGSLSDKVSSFVKPEDTVKKTEAELLGEIDSYLKEAAEAFLGKNLQRLQLFWGGAKQELRELSQSNDSIPVKNKATEAIKYIESKIKELTPQQPVDLNVGVSGTSKSVDLEPSVTTPNPGSEQAAEAAVNAERDRVAKSLAEQPRAEPEKLREGSIKSIEVPDEKVEEIKKIDRILQVIDGLSAEELIQNYPALKSELTPSTEDGKPKETIVAAQSVIKRLDSALVVAQNAVKEKPNIPTTKSVDINLGQTIKPDVTVEPKSTPILASIGSTILDQTAANEEKARIAKLIEGQPKEVITPTQNTNKLTNEALDYIKSSEGNAPAFITNNLKRIAKENNIDIASSDTPDSVLEKFKVKSNQNTAKNTFPNTAADMITPDTTAGVFVKPEANEQTVKNIPNSNALPYEEWLRQNPPEKIIPLSEQELKDSGLIKSNRNTAEKNISPTPTPDVPKQEPAKDEALLNLFKERYSTGIENSNSAESVKAPGFMERMRKKIFERKNKIEEDALTLEKAGKIPVKLMESWRGVGEWYNKQDPKVKLAISLSLTAAVLGSAALSMGTTAVAFGAVAGAARFTAGAGTFLILEKALQESQIKKVGEKNYTESKQKIHTLEALVLATLLGGGVLGNAIENVSSGRLAEALGFSSSKPPVDIRAPSAVPKTEPTETAPVIPKPEVAPSVVPTNEIPDYPATLAQEPGVSPSADPKVITAESNSATSVPVEGSKPGEPVVPATEPDTAKKPTTNLRAIEEETSPWKNESLPTSVSEYEVKTGDNMYKVIRANFPAIDALEGGRQANAIENILAKIRENPALYGLKDAKLELNVGDKINIEGIRGIIDTTEIGGKSILETAKDLSPEIVKNIENYSPAQTGTPSLSIPTPTNSGTILDKTIIDDPYEKPSVPEQPKTDTQSISDETMIAGDSVESLTRVPYITEAAASLPSGVPHPLEAHFEPSAKDFTELSRTDASLMTTARGIFNTEVHNIFGKEGVVFGIGKVEGINSDLWKSVKDVQLGELFKEKSKDESIEKLKTVLERLSGDTTHHPTGKETVEEFMKRTTLLLAEKGTKIT